MEAQMIQYIQDKWKCSIMKTSEFCLVDGFLVRDNEIKGIIELKNRHNTYDQMVQFETLLMTYEKIKVGVKMSDILNVPFYVAMRTSDNIYIYWEIYNNGKYSIGMKLDYKETNKRTEINNDGSKMTRYNAFIEVKKGKKI